MTPTRVSLVALPEAVPSTLIGLHDALASAGSLPTVDPALRADLFSVEIVGERPGPLRLATGLRVEVARDVRDVGATDIVLVPSLLAEDGRWEAGRHPAVVEWAAAMHERGALLCSPAPGSSRSPRPGCSTAARPRSTGSTPGASASASRASTSPPSACWWRRASARRS